MNGFRTRGQPDAVSAARALLLDARVHALLLVGPPGVGKTTLALDLARAALCDAAPGDRPCGTCRACRMTDHGNHPDVHRLAPTGPGGIIPIGGRGERGVRDLIGELALLPVEGGARVAIVEAADRMSEDAQSALLKTLEEPPDRTLLVLCAADEDRLLPTLRSRCVRVRLGPVPIREVERVLVDLGVADAPTAARLARATDGRPGAAVQLAATPDAVRIRAEIARRLLDARGARRYERLTAIRDAAALAADLERRLAASASTSTSGPAAAGTAKATATGSRGARPTARGGDDPSPGGDGDAPSSEESPGPARVPAAERRRAAVRVVEIWRALVRDLALVAGGAPAAVRDADLLDDLAAAAEGRPSDRRGDFLRDLDAAGEQLAGNVSPELVLDALALRWSIVGAPTDTRAQMGTGAR